VYTSAVTLSAYCYPETKHCIYVLEEGNWCIKGRYEDVIQDEGEEIVWAYENGEHCLTIQIVSLSSQIDNILINSCDRKKPGLPAHLCLLPIRLVTLALLLGPNPLLQ
jgi:hypothetical protein